MAKKNQQKFAAPSISRHGGGWSGTDARASDSRRPQEDGPALHLLDHLTVRVLIVIFMALELVLVGVFSLPRIRSRNNLALANLAVSGEKWSIANRYFERMRRRNPQSAWINLESGHALMQMGQNREALERLEIAYDKVDQLINNPWHKDRVPELYALYGQALMDAGETSRSLVSLNKALEIDPNQPLAHLTFAHIYLRQGSLVKAADHARHLVNRPRYAEELDRINLQLAEELLKIDDAELADVPEQVSIASPH